jgi:hypothetical protein
MLKAIFHRGGTMDAVTYPYKLQIFVPESLREDLKDLARARGLSLQKLVVTVLYHTVLDPPDYLLSERPHNSPAPP